MKKKYYIDKDYYELDRTSCWTVYKRRWWWFDKVIEKCDTFKRAYARANVLNSKVK